MDIDQAKDKYAELIVKGALNIQKNQRLLIEAEIAHRDIVNRITESAYMQGSSLVEVRFTDPKINALRAKLSSQKNLEVVREGRRADYNTITDEEGARLYLEGSEDRSVEESIPESANAALSKSIRQESLRYINEATADNRVHSSYACVATPKWAKLVYPHLTEKQAEIKLWERLFEFTRIDKNPLTFWPKHKKRLDSLCQKFNDLNIDSVRFISPGTDLIIGLTSKSVFKSATSTSPKGFDFIDNIPTEECYTSPDCRRTEGHVTATRPVLFNSKIVKNLKLHFKNGIVVDCSADTNEEEVKSFLNTDKGAKMLGEVAFVDITSPIYKSREIFFDTLLDENACCHIALGFGFKSALLDGPNMKSEELEKIGLNDSCHHQDIMISSEKTKIIGTTINNEEILLMKNGKIII